MSGLGPHRLAMRASSYGRLAGHGSQYHPRAGLHCQIEIASRSILTAISAEHLFSAAHTRGDSAVFGSRDRLDKQQSDGYTAGPFA
jgi:hypothetical protein